MTAQGDYPQQEQQLLRKELAPYLEWIGNLPDPYKCALELCCGGGRVSTEVLWGYFDQLHGMDWCPNACWQFRERVLNKCKEELEPRLQHINAIAHLGNVNEPWLPVQGGYHLVLGNWALEYVPIQNLLTFVQKCLQSLHPKGLLVLKVNQHRQGAPREEHHLGGGIIRHDSVYLETFKTAGVEWMVRKEIQVPTTEEELLRGEIIYVMQKPQEE